MSEVKTINGPVRLHDTALYRQGAKQVLMNLHDTGILCFSKEKSKDAKVYDEAMYQLLMNNEMALFDWLAGVYSFVFYDHEKDNKGRLVRCKARIV